VLVIVQVATLWLERIFPFPTVFAVQFFIPAMISLFLAMIDFLDKRATVALMTLQPALKATEEEHHQLRTQLTTLPAWPTILAREKAQRLDQISLRVEAIFSQIHQRIDDGAWEETEELTKVLALLETERDTLKGISTWPWSPDTLRLLITALGLPLLLWIIQYVLQLFLGS
jgi:hypothetical protein